MKHALIPCAAALLAVPQAAQAAEPLCEQLDAYAAAQWREPGDPVPRYWVEFHWGFDADSANRWSWTCGDSGDAASGQFCEWLLADNSRSFHAGLPFALIKCLNTGVPDQAAAGQQFIDGVVRGKTRDGSWVVLEMVSSEAGLGESAVRISFDSDTRRLDPADLPAIRAYTPVPEQPRPE